MAAGWETGPLRVLTAAAFLWLLAAAARADWKKREISDRLQLAILLLGALERTVFPERGWRDGLIGSAAAALPVLALTLAVPGAFGGGDIKLLCAGGFFVGWKSALFALTAALFSGGAYCLILLAARRLRLRDRIPFGPFLALGFAAALFVGERAVNRCLGLA